MDTYNDILKAVLNYCRPKISSTAFDCWIKDIKITSFENNTFTIYLISPMKKKIVSEKYDDFLKKHLKRLSVLMLSLLMNARMKNLYFIKMILKEIKKKQKMLMKQS